MDFVKGALKSGSGSSGSTGNTNQAAGGAGKEDYGDKGLSTPLLHLLPSPSHFRRPPQFAVYNQYHANNILSTRLH